MIIHMFQHYFDLENMWFYADFQLRKNHASLDRPGVARPPHIKPNMSLILFQEMKLIKGELKYWETGSNKWVNVFPANQELNKKLTMMYVDYVTENALLREK